MSASKGAWFSLLLLALFGVLLFLRGKRPNASKPAEAAVLVVTSILFFSICYIFLRN